MSHAIRAAESTQSPHTSDRTGRAGAPMIGKELLQLAPLLTAMFCVSAALGLLQWYTPFYEARLERYQGRTEGIALMIPLLFCVGVGPIMVGMEREKRTLAWLQMMPISPRRIVVTKALVALAVFSVLWIVAMTLMLWLGVDRPIATRLSVSDANVDMSGIHWTVWWSRCIAILTASFFTAWKIRHPLVSLVALLGLLSVPSVIVWTLSATGLFGAKQVHWSEITVTLGFVWGTTLCLAWAAYRTGVQVMSPRDFDRMGLPNLITASAKWFSSQKPIEFRSPLAALTWQSARSMAAVWCVLVGLLLLTLLTDVYGRSTKAHWNSISTTFGVAAVVASWIGVSVFQFSGSARSLRWISQIGHSPWRVYAARHLIPLSILCSGIAVYTFVATASGGVVIDDMREIAPLPSMLQVTLAVGLIYGISQWISQCTSITILAYLIAPVVSTTIVGGLFLGPFSVSTPRAVLMILCLLGATAWMMRKHLSGSLSLVRRILSVVVFCGLSILIMRPNSSDSLYIPQAEWNRASTADGSWADPEWDSQPILTGRLLNDWEMEKAAVVDRVAIPASRWQEDFDISLLFYNGEQVQVAKGGPLSIGRNSTPLLFSRLMFERNRFRNERQASFLESIRWTGDLVNGLRRSTRWLDQEIADRLELWLVETLTDTELNLDYQSPLIAELIDRLPNRPQRNEQRRTAIYTSYFERFRNPQISSELNIGGLTIDQRGLATERYGADRGFPSIPDSIVSAALKALESDPLLTDAQTWQRELHRETVSSLIPFSLGPYSPRSRTQTGLAFQPRYGYSVSTPVFPSRWVGLPWEVTIDQLKRERSSPTLPNETSKP